MNGLCNCINMCRIPDVETDGGRYPMPEHSPHCNDFKQKEFVRLECSHGSFIMEPNEAQALISEGDEKYTTTIVMLTQDQFDNLHEFTGF